jgi:hypothetical protein
MPVEMTKSEIQQFLELCKKLENFVIHVLKAKPTPQQLEIIRDIDNGKRRIAVKSGHGCFAKGHPVMMRDGSIKPVEDIEVGDILMGDDGKSERIVLELKRGQEEMYKFIFNSGDSHTYNASHKLVLVATQTHGTQKRGDIIEVEVKDWLLWSDRKKKTHAIMKHSVEFDEKALPIDPYIFGAWLGDGNSENDYIYLGDKKEAVANRVGGVFVSRRNNTNKYRLGIRSELKKLGVLKNKHIPKSYKTGSIRQRLQLIAGLLDTDGSLDRRQYELTTKFETLAKDFDWLCKSVGLHTNIKQKTVSGVVYYRLSIGRNTDIIPCIRHKIDNSIDSQRQNLHFGIKSVEPLGVGNYYGFTLNGNHRFLSGDFIVTRNTGKSTLLSWISLWAGLTKYDAKIPITAPSAPQLLFTLMPEIRKWEQKLPNILRKSIEAKTETISFKNGNFIAMRTARKENPEALQGFHATNLFFLVDEGSGVPDNIFEVVEGALTGEHNVIIMVGNPTRTNGYFYNAFHKHKELWTTHTLNAEKSPNVDPAIVELRRKQYGSDSDVYRVRVLGEFPRASSDSLFSVELLEEAVARTDAIDDGDEVWGLDIARYGDDRSVLAKRKGYYIRPLIVKQNLDTMDIVNWIKAEYQNAQIKPTAIFVDTIGMGVGAFDVLARDGYPVMDGNVGRKSFEMGLANKRIEIYKRLAQKMEHLSLPDDDELVGELSAIRYIINEKGMMALEKKEDTKKRLGRSPDKADAVALTYYEDVLTDEELEEEESERMRKARESRRGEASVVGVAW